MRSNVGWESRSNPDDLPSPPKRLGFLWQLAPAPQGNEDIPYYPELQAASEVWKCLFLPPLPLGAIVQSFEPV